MEVSKKGDISFFIGGMKRHMSPKQVNELFEFPLEGTIGPDSFKSFKEITSRSDWVVGFTKSFAFVSPVIRLLHRLLLCFSGLFMVIQLQWANSILGNF
ncbi:Caffeoyl-CoA O-methyltransferase 1 [Bienertia sinuspersici]